MHVMLHNANSPWKPVINVYNSLYCQISSFCYRTCAILHFQSALFIDNHLHANKIVQNEVEAKVHSKFLGFGTIAD